MIRGVSVMKVKLMKKLCVVMAGCLLLCISPGKAEGTELKVLQNRLLTLGYEIGKADGILGEKTSAAILLAQKLLAGNGYEVTPDGMPDAKTAELIMREENSELLRTLQRGSWGTRVREVQQKLINLNLLRDSADGKYGANTEAAVTAFEEKMAGQVPDVIRKDGRLSVAEYKLLTSDLSKYGFEAPIYFDDTHPEGLKETHLYARSACLINAVTGEVLFEKAADEPMEPASTTKIVTLLTALSLCDPEVTITIPGISGGNDDHAGSAVRDDDPVGKRRGERGRGAVRGQRGSLRGKDEQDRGGTGHAKLPFHQSARVYGRRPLYHGQGSRDRGAVRADADAVP